jgi:hypothetical protein
MFGKYVRYAQCSVGKKFASIRGRSEVRSLSWSRGLISFLDDGKDRKMNSKWNQSHNNVELILAVMTDWELEI